MSADGANLKKSLGIFLVGLGGFALTIALYVVVFRFIFPIELVIVIDPAFPFLGWCALVATVISTIIFLFGITQRSWRIFHDRLWLVGIVEVVFIVLSILIVIVGAQILPHPP